MPVVQHIQVPITMANDDATPSSEKMWGKDKFFGLTFDYDPQWVLDDEQKALQSKLIKLCHDVLRANAVVSDTS